MAAQAFLQAFYGCGFFAFALGSWFFLIFTGAQLGQQTGFFYGTFETAHGYFERFVLFNADCRHFISFKLNSGFKPPKGIKVKRAVCKKVVVCISGVLRLAGYAP